MMNMTQRGDTSTICSLIKKIDQRQKDAVLEAAACIGCDGPLVTVVGNTIPLAFYLCDGSLYKAIKDPTEEPEGSNLADLFRVEEVYDDCTIKCRLIERIEVTSNGEEKVNGNGNCTKKLDCLDQTVVVDLNCVCCCQCFEPINCEQCSGLL